MSYTPFENVKTLIAMLKAYNIRHIVLSPGTRNIPLVYMVEEDEFFHCYSIVDERSAAFFAIGLIQKLDEPVAICCTSGTSVCNYCSGVTEAFYQRLPLVVLTSDRNPYYLNQNEEQMIPQVDILKAVVKCSVQLPKINTSKDLWYCKNRIHAALLELDHGEPGPVQINFPVEEGIGDCSDGYREALPVIDRIYRYETGIKQKQWEDKRKELEQSKIMIVFGQSNITDKRLTDAINNFTRHYNAVVAADLLSNADCRNQLNIFTLCEVVSEKEQDEMLPDILITINGSTVSGIREFISKRKKPVKYYEIDRSGMVKDSFRCINCIFECLPVEFFEYFSESKNKSDDSYYSMLKARNDMISIPDMEYSSFYSVKRLMEEIPEDSIFHIANSMSVRLANMFTLKAGVRVYCNRGANGIDGSCSSFIGNSLLSQDKLCFLLIGDLSFFYDMNSLWNRYSNSNIRIMLQNNEGAEMFHYTFGQKLSHINKHIAAEHFATAKGWAQDRGYKYLSARNKEEFEEAIKIFMSPSDKPIFFEVFTKKDLDADIQRKYYADNRSFDAKKMLKEKVKKIAHGNSLIESTLRKAKNKLEK